MRQPRTRWISQVLKDKKRRKLWKETERRYCGKIGEIGDFVQ
jgi:hypothetical protein